MSPKISPTRKSFLKNHASWTQSFKTGFSQDGQGNYIPWMPYNLIEYLNNNLKPTDEIFEYGFGTSSIFFAKKVKKVTSIESNPNWHEIFLKMAKDSGVENLEAILMQNALENPEYENIASDFLQNDSEFTGFDWIIVDSLKRSKCVKNSIKALKPGGKLLLDDAQRLNYKKIYEFMIEKGFKCQEFEDIAPGQLKPKKAWIFSQI